MSVGTCKPFDYRLFVRYNPQNNCSTVWGLFVNKGDLIEEISRRTGLTKVAAERSLTSALQAIVDSVAKGEKVTLIDFGTFEARERKGREGRNPSTGEPISIPATTFPSFRAGKGFKEKVSG